MTSGKLFLVCLFAAVFAGSSSRPEDTNQPTAEPPSNPTTADKEWKFEHIPWGDSEKVGTAGHGPGSHTPVVELMDFYGGSTAVAYEIQKLKPQLKIGMMVAANSGRPAGGMGMKKTIDRAKVKPDKGGQEENLICSMLTGESMKAKGKLDDKDYWDFVFQKTIAEKWGLERWKATVSDKDDSDYLRTIQGVSYPNSTNPAEYGDVWTVSDVNMMVGGWEALDQDNKWMTEKIANVGLYFVAGPNANLNAGKRNSVAELKNSLKDGKNEYPSTTDRTLCMECFIYEGATDEDKKDRLAKFRSKTKVALAAGLDAMIKDKVDVALVAKLSTDIYAPSGMGPQLKKDFPALLNEVLNEADRRSHFKAVLTPDILIPKNKDTDRPLDYNHAGLKELVKNL